MLYAAISCFVLAGVLGAILLTYVLRDKPTPKGLAFIHGPVAAVGIVLLSIYWAAHRSFPVLTIVLFVLAALGGAFLIYRDLVHGKPPKLVAVIHAFLAITALAMLLMFAFR